MSREITNISPSWEPTGGHTPIWKVAYTAGNNGRTYFKYVHAKDELEAYSLVMGLREEPKRKEEQ
jgi:hypothetical protein